jgi:prolipoprotein diacylglyceryltransferase
MRYGQGSHLGRIFRFLLIAPLSGLNKNPILLRGKSFHLVHFGLFSAMNTFVTASVLLFYIDAKGHTFTSSVFLILGLCMAGDMLGVKLFHVISLGRKFFGDVGKYLNQTAMYNQGGVLGVFSSLIIVSVIEDIDLIIILDAAAYGAVIGLVSEGSAATIMVAVMVSPQKVFSRCLIRIPMLRC